MKATKAKTPKDGRAEITLTNLAAGVAKQFKLLWRLNKAWVSFAVLSVVFLLIVEVSTGILWGYIFLHLVAGEFVGRRCHLYYCICTISLNVFLTLTLGTGNIVWDRVLQVASVARD